MSNPYIQAYIYLLYPLLICYNNIVFLRKVYLYAFHLKQGGVIQPHNWNILYCYTDIKCNDYLLVV